MANRFTDDRPFGLDADAGRIPAGYPVAVMAAAFFWISVAVLVWVYVGYPLVAALIARVAPARLVANDPAPSLTVAIAVHNEAANISARIADAFEQERSGAMVAEVIVGSDGSDDETERIVRELGQS